MKHLALMALVVLAPASLRAQPVALVENSAGGAEISDTKSVEDLAAQVEALRDEVDRMHEEIDQAREAREEGGHSESTSRGNGLKTSDLARRAPGEMKLGGVITVAGVLPGSARPQITIPRGAVFGFAPVGDRISFAGEVTFLGGGSEIVDNSLEVPGRGDVYLQFAAADFVVVPDTFVLRGGLIAIPFGRDNLLSDESARDLLVRPAQAQWIAPGPWFDAGGGALGGVYAGSVRVEYQAYVVSGVNDAIDARTGLRSARQQPGRDINADKAVAARVVVSPLSWLEIGASGYTSAYDSPSRKRLRMGGLDVAINAGPIVLESEGVYAATDGGTSASGLSVPRSLFGGSTLVTWRFLPEILSAHFPTSLQGSMIGVTARYSFADLDGDNADNAPTGNSPDSYTRRDRLGLGLSFRPVESCILRAEYEFRSEGGGSFVDDDRAILSATAAF